MEKLNFLIAMFKAVPEIQQNALSINKLQHLKTELEELERNTPNDYEFGALMRKNIKDE
jgi:hypothetical protein